MAKRGAKSFLTETAQHVPSRHLVIIDADPALLARAVRQSPAIETLLAHHWMSMVALDQGHGIDVMSLLADESDYSLEI